MADAIRTMLVFLFAMTLFGNLLASTGVAATLGVSTQLGGGGAADQVEQTVNDEMPTGSSTGDTLFGLYNVLGGTLGDVLGIINPGLAMLSNAGVPAYLMEGFLIPIATVVKFLGVMYFIRGV